MDLTYEEYLEFVNHLFLQEFVDFDYQFKCGNTASESQEAVTWH